MLPDGAFLYMCVCVEAHHIGKGYAWPFSFGSCGICLVRTMFKFCEHERNKWTSVFQDSAWQVGRGWGDRMGDRQYCKDKPFRQPPD